MGKVFVLKEPRREFEWNIYALREASRLKKWFIGVYYSPKLKRLLAVFKPTPGTHVNRMVFEEIGESALKDSYRMVCPSGCGRCCVTSSGAFMLDTELRALPVEVQEKVLAQPSFLVKTPGGPVRIYKLDTLPRGRCIFFDVKSGSCSLEKYGREAKPIICLLTYCTVFAEKNGELYLKTGYRTLPDGRVEMFYRRVSEEEWRKAIARMGRIWRSYRRIQLLTEAVDTQSLVAGGHRARQR